MRQAKALERIAAAHEESNRAYDLNGTLAIVAVTVGSLCWFVSR